MPRSATVHDVKRRAEEFTIPSPGLGIRAAEMRVNSPVMS